MLFLKSRRKVYFELNYDNGKFIGLFLVFGNINNNDWYVFSLINLSYTFGRKPCYCNY